MLRMEMCLDSTQTMIEGYFTDRTEAEAWLSLYHPDFLAPGVFHHEWNGNFQYGTDYHWVAFAPISATLVPDGTQESAEH